MGPRSLQNAVLEYFGHQATQWAHEVSRKPLWSISDTRPQSRPRKTPECSFGACRTPGRKVGPGSLQKFALEYCGQQAAKWDQEASRGPFWCILGTRPQSGLRKPLEDRFGVFWVPGRKAGPGSLQKTVLEYFGHQAAKWAIG